MTGYPSCSPPCTDRLHTVVCQILRRRPGQPLPSSPLEDHYLGPIHPDRHPVTMGCSIVPLHGDLADHIGPPPWARRRPALVLLEEAIAAVTSPRPLCQEQLPIDGHPTPAALRCDLPAGHHSEEHYDRASGRVWILPGRLPHPQPEPGPSDEAWPSHP